MIGFSRTVRVVTHVALFREVDMPHPTAGWSITLELLTPEEQKLVDQVEHLSWQYGNTMFYAMLTAVLTGLCALIFVSFRQEYAEWLVHWVGWLGVGVFLGSWQFIFRPLQGRVMDKLSAAQSDPLWSSAYRKLTEMNSAASPRLARSLAQADQLLHRRLLAPKITPPREV